MSDAPEFTDYVADILKEVGNIGAAHAATALSELIQEQVNMTVPSARMVPFREVPELLGGEEMLSAGVITQIKGSLSGNLLLVMAAESAVQLVTRLLPAESKGVQDFTAMDFSALAEVGNILGGSFINAISDLTGFTLHVTVPGVAVDMAGAILSICLLSAELTMDEALLVETSISQGTSSIDAHIILIPEPDSMDRLLKALGA
ncbi:chemotaxis protein CheC [Alicyclobacillus sp. SO9]|uniref:chemotaxis protein CheC n=1 Tax=Alicyclobacillus sp. SO9 TaxID=2665646 RepID=UPI0018E826F9|nr:chemotaxis protein CheC [Alicyclobacillus sp. SO9]QQE80825.1 chemotaxis protein CheC [Alicyclobacillus sp. SO9]